MDLPSRKPVRLKEYDYSAPGTYFVTICSKDRRCILSIIEDVPNNAVGEGLAPPAVILLDAGKSVKSQILDLPNRFPMLSVDRYVIMPNHVHLLLTLRGNPDGTNVLREGQAPPLRTSPEGTHQLTSSGDSIISIVGAFKSLTTIEWHRLGGDGPLWQRSFYDHIVRTEADYRDIASYIDTNPCRWSQDRFFTET